MFYDGFLIFQKIQLFDRFISFFNLTDHLLRTRDSHQLANHLRVAPGVGQSGSAPKQIQMTTKSS